MTQHVNDDNSLFKDVTAIIMAGGKSRRMGTNKSQLPIGEETLIEHILKQLKQRFAKIIISANDIKRYSSLGHQIVPDQIPDNGPVMGLISAVRAANDDLSFVQACDIPQTDYSLLRRMLAGADGYDAVIPQNPGGKVEPLFALYRKSALHAMQHVLDHENGKATRIPAHCKTNYIPLSDTDRLRNLNTIEDYRAFLSSANLRD